MSDTIKEGIFKGLDIGSLDENKPIKSTMYSVFWGLFGYESHHKTNIKTIFENLREPDEVTPKSREETDLDWREHQDAFVEAIKVGNDKKEIDAKVRNDVYVANIMNNNELMREAAEFCLRMSHQYGIEGERADMLKGAETEVDYLWPTQDVGENGTNKKYRSYSEYREFIKTDRFKTDENYLSKGMEANKDTLERLSEKTDPYTLEETMYILRAMVQLRDVMKCEKKDGGLVKEFLKDDTDGIRKRNRIKMNGEGESATQVGHRDHPKEHKASRAYKGKW